MSLPCSALRARVLRMTRPARGYVQWLAACSLGLAGCGASQLAWSDAVPATRDQAQAYEERYLTLLDDFERHECAVHVALGRGETQVSYAVEPGWCYAFLAVGDVGVVDLDMALLDADGRQLASDSMFDATPFVQQCADRASTWQVILRVVRGSGDATLGVQRKPD